MQSLRLVFEDLGATIVRIPGDVAASGDPEAYRGVLQRVGRIAPVSRSKP